MSGRIARIPPGLLASLGIQAQGQNPNDLAGFYQPMLEMRDWILTQQLKGIVAQATNIVGPGTYEPNSPAATNEYIVPAGEWWLLYGAAIYASVTANLDGQLTILAPANGGLGNSVLPLASSQRFQWTAAGGSVTYHVELPFPIFLPPGSRPRLNVYAYVGGGEVATFNLSYARLAV